MKISEKLSELKQKEGELMRLYDFRENIISQKLDGNIRKLEDLDDADYKEKKDEFLKLKKEKVDELNTKIDALKSEIIEGKNAINKLNIKNDIDKQLLEVKYLKLELSRLMKSIKTDGYSFMKSSLDTDVYEVLGMNERIKELEKRKGKISAAIQNANWSTDVE